MSNIKEYANFEDMPIDDNLLKGIYTYGFENPSNIQKKGIVPIIENKDIIAQSQSGTGKTATFVIGAIQKVIKLNNFEQKNQILILAPTRELAIQINSVTLELIKYTKVTANVFIGGTSTSNFSNHIMIGTPGRIYDLLTKNLLCRDNIHTVILDEADEMLSRGFKDQIYFILNILNKNIHIALISATMPEDILNISNEFMKEPLKLLIQKDNLTLEGIRQYYIAMEKEEYKLDTLEDLYKVIKISQCIIYTNSKKKTEFICKFLNERGFPVTFMHGGLAQDDRKSIMEDFRCGNIKILITTDILSRGIDIQQVSLVINYDLPKEKETYIHRIGRSGRYGRKGVSINFVTDRDDGKLKELQSYYNTKIEEMPQNINDYLNI